MSTPTPGQPSQPQSPSPMPAGQSSPLVSGAQVRFFFACFLLFALIATTAVASVAPRHARPISRATPHPARTHTPAPAPTATPPAEPPAPPSAPPSVYFIASSAGTDATLNALDAASGASRWRQPLTVAADAQIAVGENIVFVLTPGTSLTAVKAADGSAFWPQPIGGEFIAPFVLDAEHDSDTLYALTQDGPTADVLLHAYRARDGLSLWPQPYDTGVTKPAALTAAGGNVYVNTGQNLIAINREHRRSVFTVTMPPGMPATASPVVDGNTVYLNNAGQVYTFDAQTGAQEWQQGTTEPGGSNALAVDAGDGLVFAAAGKTLEAFQTAKDGAPIQPVNEPQPIQGIASANGFVYLSLDGGTVAGVPAPGQTSPWSKSLGSSVQPPQVGADGTVYTMAVSGAAPQTHVTIYALDPHDGHTLRTSAVNAATAVIQFTVA